MVLLLGKKTSTSKKSNIMLKYVDVLILQRMDCMCVLNSNDTWIRHQIHYSSLFNINKTVNSYFVSASHSSCLSSRKEMKSFSIVHLVCKRQKCWLKLLTSVTLMWPLFQKKDTGLVFGHSILLHVCNSIIWFCIELLA